MSAGFLSTVIALFATNLSASVIFEGTFYWNTQPNPPIDQVAVSVTVYDSYQGDPQKEQWVYTLTNISFLEPPAPGAIPTGVQVFEVGFPVDAGPGNGLPYPLGDISQSSGWVFGCGPMCPTPELPFPNGIGWVIPSNQNESLLPGQAATFSFTLNAAAARPPGFPTGPNTIATFMGLAAQYEPGGVFGPSGPVAAPGPPSPEPVTGGLVGVGLIGLGLLGSRKQRC
jgi:hypothetical protein